MKKSDKAAYYYQICVSYEIPYDIWSSEGSGVSQAREELYARLNDAIPEKYERFSIKLTVYQLKDSLNYLITYNAFFRCREGLPMEEYVEAQEIKEAVERELEEFFEVVDCQYRKLTVKTFN